MTTKDRKNVTVDIGKTEIAERFAAALEKRRAHLQEPARLSRAAFAVYLLGLGLAEEEKRPARTMVPHA